MDIREVESAVVYKDEHQACNQGSIIQLADGDMLMAFNQERGPRSLRQRPVLLDSVY